VNGKVIEMPNEETIVCNSKNTHSSGSQQNGPLSKKLSTRREFLVGTGSLFLASLLPGCTLTTKKVQTQTTSPVIPVSNDLSLSASCSWIAKGEHHNSYSQFKKTIEAATDFSWLSYNDRVLLKVALNSGKKYPATTDPWSVYCMVKLLKEKGAGEILVGDQSSFGTVKWTKDQKIGSSRQLAQNAGLLKVIKSSNATPCFFEEFGWDAFQPAEPNGEHHWKNPIMIPTLLDEVDHIIYLPRVASHILAGNTLGFKLGVGFLRGDSRGDFHNGGSHFYAMYEEINQLPQISSKLRLTASSGRSVLTLFGPNDGPKAKPNHGLVIASEDLLAHEMLAYAWLQWNREFETSSFSHMTYGKLTKSRSRHNKQFTESTWSKMNSQETPPIDYFEPGYLYDHPAVINYLKRIGGRPRSIYIEELNKQPDNSVISYLNQHLNI
jgi:uncharacterized protein (DUF362 family)